MWFGDSFGDSLPPKKYNDKLCWIAKDVGRVLGYKDSRQLVDMINNLWSKSFEIGVDFDILEGDELSNFKKLHTINDLNCKKCTILYETGIFIIMWKSNKTIALEYQHAAKHSFAKRYFCNYIVETSDGEEINLGDQLRIEENRNKMLKIENDKLNERLRLAKITELQRKRLENNKSTPKDPKKSARKQIVKQIKKYSKTKKQRASKNNETIRVKFLKNKDWLTPTKIADACNIDKFVVGKIAKELNLRKDIPDICRSYIIERNDKEYRCFVYSPDACYQIVCKAIEDGLVS